MVLENLNLTEIINWFQCSRPQNVHKNRCSTRTCIGAEDFAPKNKEEVSLYLSTLTSMEDVLPALLPADLITERPQSTALKSDNSAQSQT